jgi:hypothetical protein
MHAPWGINKDSRLIVFKSDGQGCAILLRFKLSLTGRPHLSANFFSYPPRVGLLLGRPALPRSAQVDSVRRVFLIIVLTFV